MITKELRDEMVSRFTKVYKNLLKTHVYDNNTQLRKLFSGRDFEKAYKNLVNGYFDILVEFYKKNPGADYVDELEYISKNQELRQLVNDYVGTKNDKKLIRFLQVYSYSVQELSRFLYDSKFNLVKEEVEKRFNDISRISVEMYVRVEKDIKEGNYWWLRNTATTLRRQLVDNFCFVDTPRFRHMCEKYLERPMKLDDVKKEFTHAINGGQKLIEELDYKMEKRYNAKPYYCWWEKVPGGKRKLKMAEEAPEGIYSYIAYHDRIENRVVEKDNYFM